MKYRLILLLGICALLNGWSIPGDYLVRPDSECSIPLAGFTAGDEPAYLIRNYDGRQTGSGRAELSGGRLRIRRSFPIGFHELEFPQTGRRIGVVALPEYRGKFDDFWGVNTILMVKAVSGGQQAAFSDLNLQEDYLKTLARCGIGQIREMGAFYLRAPQENGIDFEIGHWLKLRELAQRYGIRVLTFHEHFPEWTGTDRPRQVQPTRLNRFAEPYLEMLRREAPSASGVQVFNEGDIDRKCAPPDGTAALTWLTRLLLDRHKLDTPLVAMAFCYPRPPRQLLETYAKNGLFDAADAMAFNYYDTPEKLAADLEYDVTTIAGLSRRLPPVWITESGRAWPQGTRRPMAEAARASADWIVRKAITARAFGVSRHYAFCLPFFDENKNNFGMFDRDSTPLHGFAAYAAATARLSGKRYIGDLREPPAGVRFCPVFSDGEAAVAVLAGPSEGVSLKEFPAVTVSGIDGSPAERRADGLTTAAGGLLYLELPHGRAISLVSSDTAAIRVSRLLAQRHTPPVPAAPVILRHHFEEHSRHAGGYRLDRQEFSVAVTAFNFSDQPAAVDLRLQTDCNGNPAATAAATIPPHGQNEFRLPVKLSGGRVHEVRISDRNGNCRPLFLRFTSRNPEK